MSSPSSFGHGDRVLVDHEISAEVVTTGATLVQVELDDRDHRHIAVSADHLELIPPEAA